MFKMFPCFCLGPGIESLVNVVRVKAGKHLKQQYSEKEAGLGNTSLEHFTVE